MDAQEVAGDEGKFKLELLRLLKLIVPFSIEKFINLVKDYDAEVVRVKGEDIVLILGGTGVGKSTVIHYLSGSTMVFEDNESIRHISFDKDEAKGHLQLVKVSS